MVSVQRQYVLTPRGEQVPLRLPYKGPPRGTPCDTVGVEWCDTVIPWRPCVSCKLCFAPDERPPYSDLAVEDPGFCCRCKKWKATECVPGKCCRKRRGAICRRRRVPDCNGPCQCSEIRIDAECEDAVRAGKEARYRAARTRWRPSGASTIRRAPFSGNCTEPAAAAAAGRAPRNPGLAANERFRPQTRSDFHTDPYAFCNSLVCIGPPFFIGNAVNK